MPTLEWIGKEKVINHHQEVPFRVLERQYSFDENGQTAADNGSENMIIRGDNLEALKALLPRYEGRVKCIYIDPPYNSRQYCDAYHLLENVAGWKKPKVYGVAKKMDRKRLKSDYCTMKAPEAFEQLIKDIKSRYILFSYNNMAAKGNDRSNAKISDGDIMRILKAKGDVKVFSESYKAFSTGKTNLPEHEERLFLCTCYDNNK